MINFKKFFVNIICIFMIAFSIPIILSVFIPSLRVPLLSGDYTNYYVGDLYKLSKVKYYFSLIPLRDNTKNSSYNSTLNDSDIITMGDSFFNLNLHRKFFGEKLQDSLNKSVYNVPRDELTKVNDNPLDYLEKIGYKKGKKKYLVLGSAERFTVSRALNYKNIKRETNKAKLLNDLNTDFKNIFNSSKLQFMAYNNSLVDNIESFKSTLQFNSLGEIDPKVKDYSLNPNMLFYDEGTSFVKKKKTLEVIDNSLDGIEYLSKELKERYNLELVYLAFPDKYSIYGNFSDSDFIYDGFLNTLSDGLSKRNIKNIDIYNLYKKSLDNKKDHLLYFTNDTHFTEYGEDIVIEELTKLLKS